MQRLIVATKNKGKVAEIRELLAPLGIKAVSLVEAGLDLEIAEDADTFTGNALIKARAVARAAHEPALADDSGLEVDALSGRPGVHSARYGGPGLDDTDRCIKLLAELAAVADAGRTARFRCALAFVDADGAEQLFAGALEGRIAHMLCGETGFGYDPVFVPNGYDRSIAELGPAVKNAISHRALALAAFTSWLANRTR